MSVPFLLEIGTEEIPDWMIPPAINQLRELFQDLLDRTKCSGTITSVDGTPRRLVLVAEGLAERQPDSEELVLGPPKSAGQGAATGFAKKMGTTADQLGIETTPKGEYVSFRKQLKGQDTITILATELPQLILKINFPKTMYWNGKGTERFIRPIRWIVALFGDSVVPFELAGLRAGNITQGHRLLGKSEIAVTIANFEQQLETNGVILSASKRRDKILTGIADLFKSKRLRVRPDPGLLETLVYITEFPTPILGGFDSQYLELPSEVLVTVMRHHQKYFSVEDEAGNLAPHFIAIMNTDADPEGLVRHGNERVLRARFNDARFFWQQDQKKRLKDRLPDLHNVTFHARLGSYYEKSERIVNLLASLGADQVTQYAGLYCKCDLTTDMVKEFTDLQGIIGGLYARAQDEPEEVWRAIYDHYKPLSMDGELPTTDGAKLISLADKLDTLIECFRIGLIPSGSKDPFALRRAAQGVVRIIVEGKISYRFDQLGDAVLTNFMHDRVEYYFRDVRGFAYDEVRACMNAKKVAWNDLIDLESRLKRVQAMRPEIEPIAASFKRIKNILQIGVSDSTAVTDANLLEPGPEQELYSEIQRTSGQPLESRISTLRPKLDLFFDKVLVNAPDEAVRRNRLTLLHNLLTEFSEMADFSEIVTERETRNEERL